MAASKPFVRFRLRLRSRASRPEDEVIADLLQRIPRGEQQPFLRALALVGFEAIKKDQARAQARDEEPVE